MRPHALHNHSSPSWRLCAARIRGGRRGPDRPLSGRRFPVSGAAGGGTPGAGRDPRPRRRHDQGAGELGLYGARSGSRSPGGFDGPILPNYPGWARLRRSARRRSGPRPPGDVHLPPRQPAGPTRQARPVENVTGASSREFGTSQRPRRGASPVSTSGRSGTSRTTPAISIRRSLDGRGWRLTCTVSMVRAAVCVAAAARAADRSCSASCPIEQSRPAPKPTEAAPLHALILQPRQPLGGASTRSYSTCHPLHAAGGPTFVEPSRDDATIRSQAGSAGRSTRPRAGRIGGGRLPIWTPSSASSAPARPLRGGDRPRACFWSLRALDLVPNPRVKRSRSTR